MHHRQPLGVVAHCTALLCFVSVANNYNYYDGEMNPKWENLIELFRYLILFHYYYWPIEMLRHTSVGVSILLLHA